MAIDRTSRNRLSSAIRRYLGEEFTAFEFDDEVFATRGETDDATLQFIASELWFHYDDCKDHKVVLTRQEWDLFHRLLLILESDAVIESHSRRIGSPAQGVAIAGVVFFGGLAWWLGIGAHLIIAAIPFGALSMILSRWWRRAVPEPTERERSLWPFASFGELRVVRRSVVGLVKARFPRTVESRRIRGKWMLPAMLLPSHALWLVLGPIASLFQAMPRRTRRSCVRLEGRQAVTSPIPAANIP